MDEIETSDASQAQSQSQTESTPSGLKHVFWKVDWDFKVKSEEGPSLVFSPDPHEGYTTNETNFLSIISLIQTDPKYKHKIKVQSYHSKISDETPELQE